MRGILATEASMAHQFPPSTPDEPASDWTKVLTWAETAGIENLKARHETLSNIRKEAASTLTILLAGLGAALAYAAKVAEPYAAGPVTFGAAVLCVWLVALSLGAHERPCTIGAKQQRRLPCTNT